MFKAVEVFREAAFDAETVKILLQAYDMARKSLHDKGQPEIVEQIIADRLVAAAKAGERDPEKLCATALTALGSKAVFTR